MFCKSGGNSVTDFIREEMYLKNFTFDVFREQIEKRRRARKKRTVDREIF